MLDLLEVLLWPMGGILGEVLTALVDAPKPKKRVKGPCAYCRDKKGEFVTCRTCDAPHHRECATLNRRCAVYGCADRRITVRAA